MLKITHMLEAEGKGRLTERIEQKLREERERRKSEERPVENEDWSFLQLFATKRRASGL